MYQRISWIHSDGMFYLVKLMNKIIIIATCLMLFGCTDGKWKKVTAIGNPAKVTCYSGGKVIFDGKSTGKVAPEEQSDGWFFEDAETNKLIRVSGDCVIIN